MSTKKKASFESMMDGLASLSKNPPTTQAKIAALAKMGSDDASDGNGRVRQTGDGRTQQSISAPANEAVVTEMTHLNGGAEASKTPSEVNPVGVETGSHLPGTPSLKEKELEREEKPFTEGADVSKMAGAQPETPLSILARFKENLKLAEHGTEAGSSIAMDILKGKTPGKDGEGMATPAVSSESAQRTLEGAKGVTENMSGTSTVAKDTLDGTVTGKHAGNDSSGVDVDLDVLARKTAAWLGQSELGYQAANQFFGHFAHQVKTAAALDPQAILASVKIAEYQDIVVDRAALEPAVRERQTQLKTAGLNDEQIATELKTAGEIDRNNLAFENAVRRDERQKVAAELELQVAVNAKVASYRGAGLNDEQILSALQKDAEADAAAMMGGGAPGPAGSDPGAGAPPDPSQGAPAGPGGVDPAMMAQLEQGIQAVAAQMGVSEEQILQMLEQEAAQGGQGGQGGGAPGGDPAGGGAPAGADPSAMGGTPDAGAGGAPMPPDAGGAGAPPDAGAPEGGDGGEGGGDAPAPKKKEKPDDDKDDDEPDDKKEAGARKSNQVDPAVEALFLSVDALQRAGKLSPGAAQKVAQDLVNSIPGRQ